MNEDEQKLWDEYNKDPTDKNRNALFEQYIGAIKVAVLKVSKNTAHFDDLYQYASIAMLEKVIPKYDEAKGVIFTTYAIRQLRFYIINSIRKEKINNNELSLSQFIDDNGEEYELLKGDEESPLEILERVDVTQYIFKMLDEKERLILIKYYWEDKSLTQVGKEMGISKQGVQWRLKNILNKMKNKLK